MRCRLTDVFHPLDAAGLTNEHLDIARAVNFLVQRSQSLGSTDDVTAMIVEIEEIWDNIPHTHKLAKSISPNDEKFEYLHAAQLIKHVLGLKNACGKNGFRLLYLWYDVLGYDGSKHRDEIGEFTQIVKLDGVRFHALSYQELISRLANNYRQNHKKYISYITNRYL